MKTIYMIWNDKQERPAVSINNYGCLLVYLTLEQAQANLKNPENKYSELTIKEFEVKGW